MHVTDLWIYPVKSLGGVAVDEAAVEPWGLAGDRRWGLVDDAGEQVTARGLHAMLRLRAEPVDEDTIRITDRDGASILVDTPLGLGPVPVSHPRQGFAAPADEDVNVWIRERVGQRVRLVWQEDPAVRSISGRSGGMPGERLSLADAGPVLLTSKASLGQLNSWIHEDADQPDLPDLDPADLSHADPSDGSWPQPKPLGMLRFRPNVVLESEVPFAEDGWAGVRIGEVDFRTTMLCDRCVLTTIDPVTLAGGKEPIRTLARHRRWEGKTWFGIRLVPMVRGGVVHVGDEVVPMGSPGT